MDDKGSTFIELLMVIGFIGALLAVGLFISFDFYKSYSFRSERSVIVSVLQKARSQSLNNINQVRHGVYIDDSSGLKYIIFECPPNNPQCTSYTPSSSDMVINASRGISITTPTLPATFIFEQLSGNCVSPECSVTEPTILVHSEEQSYEININALGRISW